MSVKAVLYPLGCMVAWFVFLPVLLIGGGLALFTYAIFAELAAVLTGKPTNTLDTSAARDMARRLCGGYGVPARNNRRLPTR